MGKGAGAAEHLDEDRPLAGPTVKRMLTDDPDEAADLEEEAEREQQKALQAEKTIEQLLDEAHREWRRFHYPPWAAAVFWLLMVVATVHMVLTLDQWHGTHGWRVPLDILPRDRRYGGWPQLNHSLRFTGAIFGLLGSAFSWVLAPSSDKYKSLFFFLGLGSLFCGLGFGYDVAELQRARDLPICVNSIPDINTNRYICTFEDYVATIILEAFSFLLNLICAIYLCRLAVTGAVSRRRVFNESTGAWEKYIATGDENPNNRFPRRYRDQLPVQNVLLVISGLVNASLIGTSITQSTGIFLLQGTGYEHSAYNEFWETPVTVFVVHGDEAIRFGGWPEVNFLLRLSVGTLALVTTAFAIQWRRDGRSAQLCVILLMMVAGTLYLIAFGIDLVLWADVAKNGFQWLRDNNHIVLQRRYTAVVVIDAFLGFLYFLFGLYSLCLLGQQARNPGNPYASEAEIKFREENPTHHYGWWCHGEWEAKTQMRLEAGEPPSGCCGCGTPCC